MAKTTTLTTASVLAFERKLDPSDALLYAGRWSERDAGTWQPVHIREKSVRGTISNRLKTKDRDPAKLDASIQAPNLQTVDVAALPADADTLKVRFTLRVLGGAGTPSACNDVDYQAKLLATVQGYVAERGFTELGRRYAANLANGASSGATASAPKRWRCALPACRTAKRCSAGPSTAWRCRCAPSLPMPRWTAWAR